MRTDTSAPAAQVVRDQGTGTSSGDRDLLARLRDSDPLAQEQFVRLHIGHMLAVSRRFLRCEQDCNDAVQDAFISAFAALPRFEGAASLSTWLHRVTVNACLMKLRAQRNRKTVSVDDLLPQFSEDGHHARPVPSWSTRAGQEAISDETRTQVRDCIDKLPEPLRAVVLLRDIEELDTQTTAEMLGITVANVKVRLHRARQALRTLLEPLFT